MSFHAPPPQAPPPAAPPLPRPVDYAWLTRPGRRWWRLLVSLLLFAAVWLVWTIALAVIFVVIGLLAGWDAGWFLDGLLDEADLRMTPGALLFNNLLLAGFIPATVVSTSVTQRIRPGFTHSVAGRFRWRLFGELTVVLLPVWLVYVGINAAVSGSLFSGAEPHPQLWAFLAVVWLTTPLQCAGEEYAFRGWLAQNIGGLIGMRALAWVVPTILSAGLFALLHGSPDPWVLAGLAIFATATMAMTWRSGGLEAAIALHMLNNMIIMHYTLIMGGFDSAFITEGSAGTPWDVVATLIGHAAALAVAWWWVRRRGVAHTTTVDPRIQRRRPLPPPGPGQAYAPVDPGQPHRPVGPGQPTRPA